MVSVGRERGADVSLALVNVTPADDDGRHRRNNDDDESERAGDQKHIAM